MDRSPEEIAENERHKYFLSEKQGHDVGWDVAAEDWDRHHAAAWRAGHADPAHCTATAAATEVAARDPSGSTATLKPHGTADSPGNTQRASGRDSTVRIDRQSSPPSAAPRYQRGGLRGLVWRLMNRRDRD